MQAEKQQLTEAANRRKFEEGQVAALTRQRQERQAELARLTVRRSTVLCRVVCVSHPCSLYILAMLRWWLQERQGGARADEPSRWQAQAQAQSAEAAALARLKDEEARRLEAVTAQRVAEEARIRQLEEKKRKDLQAYQVRASPIYGPYLSPYLSLSYPCVCSYLCVYQVRVRAPLGAVTC